MQYLKKCVFSYLLKLTWNWKQHVRVHFSRPESWGPDSSMAKMWWDPTPNPCPPCPSVTLSYWYSIPNLFYLSICMATKASKAMLYPEQAEESLPHSPYHLSFRIRALTPSDFTSRPPLKFQPCIGPSGYNCHQFTSANQSPKLKQD